MCHSSVIIRKHIDLTITLEQHSPAPQTGYLSPGGTWSDEAGSELILGLCFTPPAVFAPPLAPFFPVHLFLSPSLLSAHLMLHLPLPFSFPSPSLLPPARGSRHRTAASAAPASCPADTAAAPSITPCARLHAARHRLTSIPASLPARS